MATDPCLLPSSSSITHTATAQKPSATDRVIAPAAATLIQCLSFFIFSAATLCCALWAVDGHLNSNQPATAPAPFTPHPGLIWVVLDFFAWLGYLQFIRYVSAAGPWTQRKIFISISVRGKVILAVAHLGAWYMYKRVYVGVHPSMLLLFLASQASLDVPLVVAYALLRNW